MSAFTETAFLKKLSELNSSQQSIQTLSLWLIHHRKHHAVIVKTWLRELQTVTENKKLIFMYLANDVIQNSKKKGPEYGKEFATILAKVYAHIGQTCTSERLFGSLGRILNIWEERGVYDIKTIDDYRARLNKEHKSEGLEGNEENAGCSNNNNNSNNNNHNNNNNKTNNNKTNNNKTNNNKTNSNSSSTNNSNSSTQKEKSEKREKRKHEETKSKTKKSRRGSGADEKHATPTASGSATATTSTPAGENGQQSPYTPLGDPPEPEELIKALISIENSASSDAAMRERIANLPPEISEIGCLLKLEDKEQAKALQNKVNEAVQLLTDYNGRLATEMEERTKLASMLRNYQAEQKELLAQAEQRLEEYKKKLSKMVALKKEIRDHLSNLPDLTQLPDVTGGLAPLPSAGDLFNLH